MPEQTENCREHTLPPEVGQHRSATYPSTSIYVTTKRTSPRAQTKFSETIRLSTLKDTLGRKVRISTDGFLPQINASRRRKCSNYKRSIAALNPIKKEIIEKSYLSDNLNYN